jgi:hypothetical protein
MLAITQDAPEAIRTLIDKAGPRGVRISTSAHSFNGFGPAVRSRRCQLRRPDQVVNAPGGTRVFLAPTATAFDGKILDAELDGGELHWHAHAMD